MMGGYLYPPTIYRLTAISGKSWREYLALPLLYSRAQRLSAINGDSCSIAWSKTLPYPWWDAMVGSKVGYFLPVKANYYCWTNLHP